LWNLRDDRALRWSDAAAVRAGCRSAGRITKLVSQRPQRRALRILPSELSMHGQRGGPVPDNRILSSCLSGTLFSFLFSLREQMF